MPQRHYRFRDDDDDDDYYDDDEGTILVLC